MKEFWFGYEYIMEFREKNLLKHFFPAMRKKLFTFISMSVGNRLTKDLDLGKLDIKYKYSPKKKHNLVNVMLSSGCRTSLFLLPNR